MKGMSECVRLMADQLYKSATPMKLRRDLVLLTPASRYKSGQDLSEGEGSKMVLKKEEHSN